jgi:hypothetical protein
MQPHPLDQRPDLRLGAAQQDRPPVGAEATGEDGDVEHQRGIGEDQLGQVDDDVCLGPDGPGQGRTPEALRVAVLITAATQRGRLVIEVNDGETLVNVAVIRYAGLANVVVKSLTQHDG